MTYTNFVSINLQTMEMKEGVESTPSSHTSWVFHTPYHLGLRVEARKHCKKLGNDQRAEVHFVLSRENTGNFELV